MLATAWNLHVQSLPAPGWLSELVAAHPALLARFCDSAEPSEWDPVDPWGYEYWVDTFASGVRRIVSSGPDGLEGTEDDLWIEVADRK